MKEIYIFYLIGERYIGKKCVKKIYMYMQLHTYIHLYLIHWGHMARRGLLVIGAIG